MPSTNDKYAPTTWGQTNEFDFTTPSGQLCRLRRTDPTDLIAAGLLDKLDFLTATVLNEHIPNGRKTAAQKAKDAKEKVGQKEKTPEQLEREIREKAYKELLSSPDKFEGFKETINNVVVMVVVAPPIHPVPQPDEDGEVPEREEGLVYVDTVDFNDKMAIFNEATKGAAKLEPFREEPDEAVGAVASKPSSRKSPKRVASDR